MDRDLDRLRRLEEADLRDMITLAASSPGIGDTVLGAHRLIGAVLVGGSRTSALVDRAKVGGIKPGSVIVDVDVDNCGCIETSRLTTLEEPTFAEAGVAHYCLKNIPAAVPFTVTRTLSNALLPYVREVPGRQLADALNSDAGLGRGGAVAEGRVVDPGLARATGTEHNPLSSVLLLHSEAR